MTRSIPFVFGVRRRNTLCLRSGPCKNRPGVTSAGRVHGECADVRCECIRSATGVRCESTASANRGDSSAMRVQCECDARAGEGKRGRNECALLRLAERAERAAGPRPATRSA
jgi:hypothetical protein